ncbi:CLUMA_CG009070, isoform A [Clunio marinus]|uniref:CLUMA_CG009070, isoform A n=1 Tax=Clunio marinus TaxID=568069 RepID=A0A1J1I5Z7_9DIPT|nr:CLUMA_CG009070, isoform A [Clunio marinus]
MAIPTTGLQNLALCSVFTLYFGKVIKISDLMCKANARFIYANMYGASSLKLVSNCILCMQLKV